MKKQRMKMSYALAVLSLASTLCAQTAVHDTLNLPFVKGAGDFSTTQRCKQWEADWIGRPEKQGYKKPFVYARKSFTLDRQYLSAVIHVSAKRNYKLHVNGFFVGDGPPRNVDPRFFYVSYEIGSLLKPGQNTLAIEYGGSARKLRNGIPVYDDPLSPEYVGAMRFEGVIAQLELHDGQGNIIKTISTDESWKLSDGPWTNLKAITAGGEPPEVFAGNLEPFGWKTADFNDAGWYSATVIGKGIMKPVADPDKDVVLEPSPLPHYQRETVRPVKIEFEGEVLDFMGDTRFSAALQMVAEIPRPPKHTRIENAAGLLNDSHQPAKVHPRFAHNDISSFNTYWDKYEDIPEVCNATLILDYGKLRNAFIQLDVEGTAGSLIDIAWGQTLVDGRVLPILYARFGEFEAEGKPNQLNAHRYFLREGRQEWESFNWQNFRYLQLTFRKLNGPLKLHSVNAIASGLPWNQRGQFHCSDPLLDRFFEMSGNTLKAASYDSFMDNTIREKVIYGGDIADGSMSTSLPLYGDAPVVRNYMNLWTHAQNKEGWLPEQALSKQAPNHNSHSYRTGFWMAEYAYWCEDQEYYKNNVWPVVIRLLDFYKAKENAKGLIEQETAVALWVDWCSGLMAMGKEIPYPAERLSVPVNLLYASLLQKAAGVAQGFGENERAAKWRSTATQIGRVIYDEFWDEQTGLYLDGALSGYKCSSYSEHANYLALLNGLGRDGRSKRILKALLDPGRVGSIVQSGPSFMFWPPAGLFAVGEDRAAIDMLRSRYSRFLRMGLETFCETWTWTSAYGDWNTRYRSLAQNGAGSPAWYMTTEVLGVKPTKPGFSEFEIKPQPGDLEWAQGIVPSPKGDIPVRWEKKEGKLYLDVTVPKGTRATVIWQDGSRRVLKSGLHQINHPQ